MFNFFNLNLRPFMDEVDSGSGGVATSQETTSTESTTDTSTEQSTDSTESAYQSEGATDAPTEVDTKPKQTPEQDRAYAELRRSKEAAERRAMEVEGQRQRDAQIARKFGQYGVFSDADVAEKYGQSHGIHNVAQFEEALRRQEYESKGIDPDMVKKLVDEHPDLQAAREFKQAAIRAQEDNFLVSSFDELIKEYPEIKGVADVPPDVWRKWKNGSTGLTLPEAYLVVERKNIEARKVEAAKQATLNNIQSKDHVRGNGKGVEGDTVRIPDDVLAQYRALNPGKSMDDYKKHWKKSQNK